MHYFVFNNGMCVATQKKVERLKGPAQENFDFSAVRTAHVCVVDIDVLTAVAPEEMPEQKDLILTKEFASVYPGEYIIQEERIGSNLFQVVGVKTQKVREIYARMPGKKILTFTPYAMALRAFLSTQKIDPKSIVVFVDDAGGETLITFFEGARFSQTRRFNETEIEKILPEVKRSAIGFTKAIQRENDRYTVITNNLTWAGLIEDLEPEQVVRYIDARYPAIEGLKKANFPFKFELPEEILQRNKEKEFKSRIPALAITGMLLVLGLGSVLFYRVNLFLQTTAYENALEVRNAVEQKLMALDREVYRSVLRGQKRINYGDVYLGLQHVVPQTYAVDSLVFSSQGQKWYLELLLSLQKGESFDDILVKKPFTKMSVQDVFIKDRPGKLIRIEL